MRKEVDAVFDSAVINADGSLQTNSISKQVFEFDDAWRANTGSLVQPFQGIQAVLDALQELVKIAPRANEEQTLSSAVGPEAFEQAKSKLLEFIRSVPRAYILHFPINTRAKLQGQEIKLDRNLALCGRSRPVEASSSLFGLGALGVTLGSQLVFYNTLRVQTRGYISSSIVDAGMAHALATLRQFVGMAIATQVMTYEYSSEQTQVVKFEVIDKLTSGSMFLNLPDEISAFLAKQTIPVECFETDAHQQLAIATAFRAKMAAITLAIRAKPKDGKHLRTASEWLFDSEAESNETTALLFASIGLEAGLDSPNKETTERLGDRLAWSLGGSLSQRNKMAADYKKFYAVRCDLAHGRERHLDTEGKKQLRWGQAILRLVIAKELDRFRA
jgi:hypothetical protein